MDTLCEVLICLYYFIVNFNVKSIGIIILQILLEI